MNKTKNIFCDKFINFDKEKIVSDLREYGVFFLEKAVNDNFLNLLLEEVINNKFSINKNWVSGVYTEGQYYVKHLLACSKSFYSLVSSKGIFDFCNIYFDSGYRLKAFRYYETYSNHIMKWHTDNKITKKYGDVLKEIPGIIFIVYLDNVMDGEFQFVKKSHKNLNVSASNNYTDDYIFKNYNQDIISFKGGKGDLVIYDTYGIHRAKPVSNNKNFVRKSLFIQIDANLESAEPSLLNPSFFVKLDEKTLRYFGFGLPSQSIIYPDTNIYRLPLKIFFSKIFFQYIFYKFSRLIYNMLPKKIGSFIKKIFKSS